MMQRNQVPTSAVCYVLNAVIFCGLYISNSDNAQAAEKKTYSKPPFAAFSSQMTDGLNGGGKYEKPVWNLHDALNLPDWLSLSLEHRTRYETLAA